VVKDGRVGQHFITPRIWELAGDLVWVAVTEYGGWAAVDWHSGTVAGQEIEVHWMSVQAVLIACVGHGSLKRSAPGVHGAPRVQRQPPRIDYRSADALLVPVMQAMIADGRARNGTDAARAMLAAGRIAGRGTDSSKVKRLTRSFLRQR